MAADGTVTFNDFNDVQIAANATETFIVTVSIVDGADAVSNSPLLSRLVSVDAEDDERDDVTVTGSFPFTSARQLSITGFGVLTLTEDNNNADNMTFNLLIFSPSGILFNV